MSDDYELFCQDLEEVSQDLSGYAEYHAQYPASLPSFQPATSGPAATCGKTVLSWVPGDPGTQHGDTPGLPQLLWPFLLFLVPAA